MFSVYLSPVAAAITLRDGFSGRTGERAQIVCIVRGYRRGYYCPLYEIPKHCGEKRRVPGGGRGDGYSLLWVLRLQASNLISIILADLTFAFLQQPKYGESCKVQGKRITL